MRFNIKEMKYQGIFLGILSLVLALIITASYVSQISVAGKENDNSDEQYSENTDSDASTSENNKTENNGTVQNNTAVAEHTHSWVRGSTVAPTCTEKGYTINTCSCGKTKTTDEKDALGHNYGDWETVKEATVDAEGLKERTCERCKAVEKAVIEKENGSSVILPGEDGTPEDGEQNGNDGDNENGNDGGNENENNNNGNSENDGGNSDNNEQ